MRLGKADLHIHSDYSQDAFSSIREILKQAKTAGMDIVAITDHDTIEGAQKAQEMAAEYGVEVIIGEEISTKQGEIIGLFLKERILPGLSVLETIQMIKQQGGLTFTPHLLNLCPAGLGVRLLRQLTHKIDGVEVFNCWTGKKKFVKMRRLNEKIFKLASIGGSDAHFAGLVGRAYTTFEGTTALELYAAIKNKSTDIEGGFWSLKDYFVYAMHWLQKNFRQRGFSIVFDLLRSGKKVSKRTCRRFSDAITA